MRTSALALTLAFTAIACDDKQAPPTSKESTPTTSASAESKAAQKEIPATSTNIEALKAYRAGVDFADNQRLKEAHESFKKAVALDPKFPIASAALGWMTPGTDGDRMLATAMAAATSLSEAERVQIQVYAAKHALDRANAVALTKKLTELAPNAWNAHYQAGDALWASGKLEESKAFYQKAITLEPTAAAPRNDLGYVAMMTGDSGEAIVQLNKYAELRPKEANPRDSYGEALLLAGKYDDSKASFEKALEIDPGFIIAYQGIGFDHLYKGEYAKAYDALGKLRDAKDGDWNDTSGAYSPLAWGQLAENKLADALKTMDAFDVAADKASDADTKIKNGFTRARLVMEGGKPADAIKILTTTGDAIDKSEAPPTRKARWHTIQHAIEALVSARIAKPEDAEKARAAAEASAGKSDDAEIKTWLAVAKGAALSAKGDAAGAAGALKDCPIYETTCISERMKAEDKAGQKDAAAESRALIQKYRPRNGESFFVWKQNAPATK